MANKSTKLMVGVNDLLDEIQNNSHKIFSGSNIAILSLIDRENDSRLRLIIPDKYWTTETGQKIHNRLMLKLNTDNPDIKNGNRGELSNLLTGNAGHTGVKATRLDLARDLSGNNFSYLENSKSQFNDWFSTSLISESFSIQCLPSVFKCLTRNLNNIKKDKGSSYSNNDALRYDINLFHRALQNLCSAKKYSDFFWWLFLYALFQAEITNFISYFPQTQYKQIADCLNTSKSKSLLFNNTQVLNLSENKFWDIRRKLVESAYGHLIIAGPSLRDAFSVDDNHTLVASLTNALEHGALTKVSILITDPIIFDSHINCGDPIRDISGTIESLQERFYSIFEKKQIDLHIYFLPLLQIDHAVITEEFMAFRSNKLWNHERKYKGAFCLYLADYYTPNLTESSEYLAHKEYLCTVMENCTTIYPSVDVDHSLLDKTSAKSKHMHWRNYLDNRKLRHIYFHKLYEKQIFSYVCNTWSANNELIGQLTPSSTILHSSDLFNPKNLLNDDTQKVLLPYLRETQTLFDKAIRKHDPNPNSFCTILPSLDLGIPNNVQRLAGGFATGMLVTWQCGIDIVPIDATVNVCTSSIFKLKNFVPESLQDRQNFIITLEKCFSDASSQKGYSFSFTSGNHFLIIAQDKDSNEYYLVLHSSANELKNSYMGLYPVEGNWYASEIKNIPGKNGRYFHYLKDEEARHFIRMAKNFKSYNEQIHKWLAERINGAPFSESEMLIKHHYYMPTDNSIALGTFAEPIGEKVPIFSAPGKKIYIFEIGKDNWQVNLGGNKGNVCLVPHGWGQKIDNISSIKIEHDHLILSIGNREEKLLISSKSHIDCAEKMLRDFKDGHQFLQYGRSMIQGNIIKELTPCFEYSLTTKKEA